MKLKKYIAPLFIALLVLAGMGDVSAQSPLKSQFSVAAATLEFSAYVNGQYVRIDFETAPTNDYTIELYNLTGAKIGEWHVQKSADKYSELNLDEPLRKGLYIIKVSAGQNVMAKKVQV